MRDGIMDNGTGQQITGAGFQKAINTGRSFDGPEPAPMTATACREPLISRLQREADSYGEQAAKKARAIELLLIHPEFEDLIELLRIVNIY